MMGFAGSQPILRFDVAGLGEMGFACAQPILRFDVAGLKGRNRGWSCINEK